MKRFCISGPVFWGWHTDINLDQVNSNEQIYREIKKRIMDWIKDVEKLTGQDDLYGLRQAAEALTCNFHGMSFEDILTSDADVIYMCHCDHAPTPSP